MINVFDKKMKFFKDEITDLKTSHKRGLGLIDFYRYTASWTIITQRNARITAVAKEGSPTPFFCQLSSNRPKALELFKSTSVSGRTITWEIYGAYNNTGTLTVEAISTVELESFTIRAV